MIDKDKLIIKRLGEGFPVDWIAAELRCSDKTVYSHAKKAGWTFQSGRGGAKNRPKAREVVKKGMCKCCGKRVIPSVPVNGVLLTRLCATCFREGENYGEW